MNWTKMNYRHLGWNLGYRYYTTWTGRQGLWGSKGQLIRYLREEYGADRLYLSGPPTEEDLKKHYWRGWHLPYEHNPHWGIDSEKRRIYVTEKTLLWARLQGRCD